MNSSITITRYLTGVLLAAAVLVSGFTLLAMRAHADNGAVAPVISGITATPTDTGATITWTTDQNATTQVMYGPTSAYNASSTLGTATTTSHTSFLGGLSPNTMYHFEVVSGNASGTLATSSDMTFTTASSTMMASTTPVISAIMTTPSQTGAVVVWNTDLASNSQVRFGLTNLYGNTSTLDTNNVTSHSVSLSGLNAGTLYHFQVWSQGTGLWASSTDMVFTTLMATTTATTTDTTGLQNQIDALKARVSLLESQIAALLGMGGGTTTPPTGGTGMIDANNNYITAGNAMDLSGRNFGHEESVKVTLNGNLVATAHADGGGNFSTGSFMAPSTPGTYTFVFTGQTSGITGSASIIVH